MRRDHTVSLFPELGAQVTTELDTFYEMLEDIGIAMMTTRRPDGHLESRAMANQKRAGKSVV